MGRALRDGYRKRAFLMTKIDGRTRQAAADQIDQCLRAFGTDVIDLVQIHEVIRLSDPDRVFGPSGAIEALEAARKAGKIRFVGFTGHKSPEIHLRMLAVAREHQYHFDTVQLPINVMDPHYRSFGQHVVPELVKDEIGVLGMKPLGSGLFLRSEPMQEHTITPTECLHFAMSQPTSVVITGCDTLGILMQGIDAAYRWHPMNEPEKRAALARTGFGRQARRVGEAARPPRHLTGRLSTRGGSRPRRCRSDRPPACRLSAFFRGRPARSEIVRIFYGEGGRRSSADPWKEEYPWPRW